MTVDPHRDSAGPSPGLPPLKLLAAGVLAGALIALVAVQIWNVMGGGDSDLPGNAAAADAPQIACFRLPWGGEHELLLVRAGPDAMGEPRLSSRLFPQETPARQLASLILANVSADERWEVDLRTDPLLARDETTGEWQPVEPVAVPGDDVQGVSAAEALRLRALGAGLSRVTVEPRSLRRVLLALPPRRGLDGFSGVKWGAAQLLPDRIDALTLRRFRVDPARVGATR